MNNIIPSKSTEKGSFTRNNAVNSAISNGIDPKDDVSVSLIDDFNEKQIVFEQNDEWQKNNMEYDLRTCEWILDKVRKSEQYAQNLYAAMCNNEFVQCDDIWNILKKDYWGASWRRAGGIIADMQEKGDYIDWYCSGMRNENAGYVAESVITDEIRNDLMKLGWDVIPQKD
jgi:hypothetical protein